MMSPADAPEIRHSSMREISARTSGSAEEGSAMSAML